MTARHSSVNFQFNLVQYSYLGVEVRIPTQDEFNQDVTNNIITYNRDKRLVAPYNPV